MVPCSFDLIFCPIQEYIWLTSGDLQVFKQEGVVVTPRDFTYISFDLFYCPLQENIWFRGGDLDRLQDNSTFSN